jgi:predicted O-linked N-acetylglucosamine transferase (SPINDLY family)
MDWFLTDRWETPPELAQFYSERLLLLPDGWSRTTSHQLAYSSATHPDTAHSSANTMTSTSFWIPSPTAAA